MDLLFGRRSIAGFVNHGSLSGRFFDGRHFPLYQSGSRFQLFIYFLENRQSKNSVNWLLLKLMNRHISIRDIIVEQLLCNIALELFMNRCTYMHIVCSYM